MDRYHAVHGHDVSSFDIPSTHRLPAVSAAQALEDLNGDLSQCVSTGLCELDRALVGAPPLHQNEEQLPNDEAQSGNGGVVPGQVTEFWGPPGCGKTAIGIQLAAFAMSDDRGVVWVDCTYPVSGSRLSDVVDTIKSGRVSADTTRRGSESANDDTSTGHTDAGTEPEPPFAHYLCPTLAHFVALVCKPSPATIPSNTCLVVIDSLSALINEAYPKVTGDGKKKAQKNAKGPGFGTRRLQTLQYIIGALQKLAATRNCAVVLLSQCATKIQSGSIATLIPAVNASVWDQRVSTRVVLFKDFAWRGGVLVEASFAGVQKVAGKATAEGLDPVVGFRIGKTGLTAFQGDNVPVSAAMENALVLKRKFKDTGFELADSEDKYGWESDDARHLPPEPPQWQGSEDLIVGTQW